MKDSFHEIAVSMAPKQQVVVDPFLRSAPILAAMPMEASSHGLWNVYEELDSVTGGDIVDFDGALPTVGSSSILKQKDLSIIGALIEVPEDTARKFGGAPAYFAKKLPAVLDKTGEDTEKNILYNVFRNFAHEKGKLVSAGGSAGINYSMLCIHYVPGEMTGLYDEGGFGNGKVFDFLPLSGGSAYKNEKGQIVYGMRMKSYIGIQTANSQYISGIVNIDLVNNKLPSAKDMSTMIRNARGGSSTFIYCHPAVKDALGDSFKFEKMHFVNPDNNINTVIDGWNGIPILTSFNFIDGTEDNVAIA